MTRPIQTLTEFKSLIDAVQIVALFADDVGASYAGLLFRSGMLKIEVPYSKANRPFVTGEAPWEWARLRELIETICKNSNVILPAPADNPQLDIDHAYGELWITKAELHISAHEELAAFNRLELAFRRFGLGEAEIDRLLSFRAPGNSGDGSRNPRP